jgi:hypothetical protein
MANNLGISKNWVKTGAKAKNAFAGQGQQQINALLYYAMLVIRRTACSKS